MNTKGTSEHSLTVVLPEYEIVDCEGKTLGPFKTAAEAGAIAIALFGDRQDPDRTGAGWDVQVVGS
jgi:hypothetical protein